MFTDHQTVIRLSSVLNLPYDGTQQDWELELSDKTRLPEFISFLTSNNLTDEERYAVMKLIISSYDDYLSEKLNAHLWEKIVNILSIQHALYLDILNYWACWDVKTDNVFKVTPLIRKYLRTQ